MFVPKVPRRYDFCGCPPCGLCFDYVQPAPPVEDNTLEQMVVDGLIKMTEDLTGKAIAECTEAEVKQVKGIAEDMHNRNLVRQVEGLPPDEDGAVFVNEKEELYWLEKNITMKREAQEKQKKYEAARAEKKPSLDEINWGATDEAKGIEEEKQKEKEKELKKAAKVEVSQEMRAREQQEAYNRMLGKERGAAYYDAWTNRYRR